MTLYFIGLSICGFAQPDTLYTERSIVLLKNEGLLIPFKHLDSLSFEYSTPFLKNLGERYTRNIGVNKVLITDDINAKVASDANVLLLFGEVDAPPVVDMENYEAVVFSNKTD